MALIVDVPDGYEAERRYVLGVVLADWLGLDWRLEVQPRSDVRIRLDSDGHERAVVLPDVLFALPPEDWLTEAALPALPLAWTAPGSADDRPLPVLYGDAAPGAALAADGAGGLRLAIDVLGSAFFMLTRYEELLVAERDRYGRLPGARSVAGREGFLRVPVVDAYVELLWSALERTWPGLERRPRAFELHITHDVDQPLTTLGRGPAHIVAQMGADILVRRDIGVLARRVRSLAAGRRGDHRLDPYNTFDYLMDVSERHGRRSSFYFIPARELNPDNGPYLVEQPWIRALVGHIHRRAHEVGYHASFHSHRDPDLTRDEFARLRSVAEAEGVQQERWGGRQHYLRWENPVTWRNWDDAGLDYDCTLAFYDAVGFRTGTCHPYRVFDLHERRALDLVERPFQVMEATLFEYMGLSDEDAHAAVLELAAECRRYGGSLGILWHNNSLPTARQKRWYESMLEAVSNP